MPKNSADAIYEMARRLPASDRLRLVEKIAHDLSCGQEGSNNGRYKWTDIGGTATDIMNGEDAQVWVTRSREETDSMRGGPARGGK